VSWDRAKGICRQILSAPPDKERELADQLIEAVNRNGGRPKRGKRPLSPRKAIKRLTKDLETRPKTCYTVSLEDLLSLFMILAGEDYTELHVEQVRNTFPGLIE
jgi:hypothetical protein